MPCRDDIKKLPMPSSGKRYARRSGKDINHNFSQYAKMVSDVTASPEYGQKIRDVGVYNKTPGKSIKENARILVSMLTENLDLLCESPRIADPENFGLGKTDKNRKITSELLSEPNCREIANKTYEVSPTLDGRNVLFVLSDYDEKIAYYVSWEIEKLSLLPKESMTQVAVWRGLTATGAPSSVFWNYIFPKTGIVVSDRAQTGKGADFWKDRMGEAFYRLGYNVYLLDFGTKDVILLDEGDVSIENLFDRAYGKSAKFALLRYCISKDPLKHTLVASDLYEK